MDGRLIQAADGRVVAYGAAAVAAIAAWSWLGGAAVGVPHHAADPWRAYAAAVLMWSTMTVAMMAPVVAPWLAAYLTLLTPPGTRPSAGDAVPFAAGYFAVWLAYSAAAAGLQLAVQRMGLAHGETPAWPLAAGVLVAAGVAQFLPLRQACLRHCRNPLTYLLARWRNGPASGLRLGLTHGAYCLGCCWLLMLTALGMGTMNLAWMALLTVLMVLEQAAPGGARLGRVAGILLVVWGVVLGWLGVAG